MKDMREVLYDGVCELLDDLDVDFFLGGSRRFGWEHDNSDWDLFAYVPIESNVSKEFLEFGFIDNQGNYIGDLFSYSFKLMNNEQCIVHLNVIVDKAKFDEIKVIHQTLYNKTRNNESGRMIMNLKKTKINTELLRGSDLFKVLLIVFDV